jgi:hypothetical protein
MKGVHAKANLSINVFHFLCAFLMVTYCVLGHVLLRSWVWSWLEGSGMGLSRPR